MSLGLQHRDTSRRRSVARGLNAWIRRLGVDIGVLLVGVACVFPFYIMLTTSLKSRIDAINPAKWLFDPTLANYVAAFQTRGVANYLSNSLIVVLGTTVLSLALAVPAAYGLARFRFRRKEDVSFWILSLRMLPAMSVVIPFFLMGRFLGLLDTQILLIIVYMTFNVPFAIWMLRGFIEDIPAELEEAAWVDGCSLGQGLRRVILPLVRPGIAATAIFIVIQSWNEFALAMFLTSFEARTLPATVTMFLSVTGVLWGEMAAVGVITTLPVLVFGLLAQRHLVRGLTFGAIK